MGERRAADEITINHNGNIYHLENEFQKVLIVALDELREEIYNLRKELKKQ